MNHSKIGIDAGGTLVKVAYSNKDLIKYKLFSSHKLDEVVTWIRSSFHHPKICLTGGKQQVLANKLELPTRSILEFDATCKGVAFILKQHQLFLGDSYILANIGTGTSIHIVKNGEQQRIGGTGVGGGTLMGLSYLYSGKKDFTEIIQISRDGNRGNVDLKVNDIFEGIVPPISGDLTASNFGNIGKLSKEFPSQSDIIVSIIGLIGETVVTICEQAANRFDSQSIVYIGSTFRSNPILKNIIREYTEMRKKKPLFLEEGEFSGAVGALISLQ
ncbi:MULTISPECIES: type II pantothenate kinase [Bacillaceae]|uniref:type II pantothenate kinase n=1 Tax=Bacillaceae TaxID=186817 RepID=UPI002A11AF4D|nr:type II pantothenate kinase [Cytobacillus sp. IB215316]MDX8360525.1 type II pantothenate kinase [Cytobacillus sp. IB215316]